MRRDPIVNAVRGIPYTLRQFDSAYFFNKPTTDPNSVVLPQALGSDWYADPGDVIFIKDLPPYMSAEIQFDKEDQPWIPIENDAALQFNYHRFRIRFTHLVTPYSTSPATWGSQLFRTDKNIKLYSGEALPLNNLADRSIQRQSLTTYYATTDALYHPYGELVLMGNHPATICVEPNVAMTLNVVTKIGSMTYMEIAGLALPAATTYKIILTAPYDLVRFALADPAQPNNVQVDFAALISINGD